MSTVSGPDFIALQVRDIERAAEFYESELGLTRASPDPRKPSCSRPSQSHSRSETRCPEPISTVDSPASAWRYGYGQTTPKAFMTNSPSTA